MPEPASPVERLAAEAALFESLPEGIGRLFLWRSLPSVVIGKNQNPWRECDPARIEAEGGIFARRQSGGGTVYHDPGNVCYSLMMPRDGYDADDVGEVIANALTPLGLKLSVGPRHVLLAGGRKVSGTAFCYRKQRVLHHGTLLLDAKLDRLHNWLTPALPHIQTKGVASVPSPVVNLRELQPDLTVEAVLNALSQACGRTDTVTPDPALVATEAARYATHDWRFGLTPAFSLGEVKCRKGIIESAPDALQDLIGRPFADEDCLRRLRETASP
jgi:lipoate-protein ligase A